MSLETAARPRSSAREPNPDRPLPPLPDGWLSLGRAFVASARRGPRREAMADSTGTKLNYGDTLLRAVALSRVLGRKVGPSPYVGIFVPPTVAGAVVNIAVTLLGKIPVNLNYSAGQAIVDTSIAQCGITHVVTSSKALDRFKITPKASLIILEDVPKQITTLDKIYAAVVARVVPSVMLGVFLPGLRGNRLDATATVIFTSGSTGDPKGVVLSHRNVLSNIHQFNEHLRLVDKEVVLGILPFFHSFGFTICIWTVLCLGKQAVYHFNPLDARIVASLCERYGVTMIPGTPTFMAMYLEKGKPEQFKAVAQMFLGAEKLKAQTRDFILEKLGVPGLEGYGCTELSPVVAVNVPFEVTTRDGKTLPGNKIGTVGRPLPGTEIKTVDPETDEDLPRGAEGLIYVRGPQVMVGYLNRPEMTAAAVKDGWYNTGDVGRVDEDGFLSITGRLSRFAKIGGEMVSLEAVEAAIEKAAGAAEKSVALTSLPDERRGERLFAIHAALPLSREETRKRLLSGDLPKLWIPAAEDFIEVDEVPTLLGGSKFNMPKLREIAERALAARGGNRDV